MMDDLAASRAAYFSAALMGDRAAAAGAVADVLAADTAPERIVADLLASVQLELGLRWERGQLSVAHEHLVSCMTTAALASLTFGFEPPPGPYTMALACADGEYHDLPGRMAAELFVLLGLRVVYLGPIPAAHMSRFLDDADVDVVGLSCTLPGNLPGAAKTVEIVKAAGIPVIAGGRAFGISPHRARVIGADGWMSKIDINEPFELDDILWRHSEPARGEGPWTRLAAERPRLVSEVAVALARLAPGAGVEAPSAPLVDELTWLLKAVEGALVSEDPAIVAEHLAWLDRRSLVDPVARVVRRDGTEALVDAMDDAHPMASDVLDDCLNAATSR